MRTILLALALGFANLAHAAEMTSSASEPNAFNQIDQNADGFLTPAEIAAALR